MKEICNWVRDFRNLDTKRKLEVIEAIEEELINCGINDTNNVKRKQVLHEFFDGLKERLSNKEKIQNLDSLINRFFKISNKNIEKAADSIFETMDEFIKRQKQDDVEAICATQGHDYTKWYHGVNRKHSTGCIDHQTFEYDYDEDYWSRICNRCKHGETVYSEPEDLIQERERKERKEKIKSLEIELKVLKEAEEKDI